MSGLTVLLVEDEPDVRVITAAMAQELGYQVIDVGSAEDALELLQRTAVDLLIADIGLPGMSGALFAAHARELKPNLGIVFATGSSSVARFADDGTNTALLKKPYNIAALGRALAAVGKAG